MPEWKVKKRKSRVNHLPPIIRIYSGDRRIALMERYTNSLQHAQMIAAAPDLLEAAKYTQMRLTVIAHLPLQPHEIPAFMIQVDEMVSKLKSAIKKAEGK